MNGHDQQQHLVWFVALGIITAGVASVAFATGMLTWETKSDLRIIDEIRADFPQTQGWFRIVGTARFERDDADRFVPDLTALTHERVRWKDNAGRSIQPRFAATFRGRTQVANGDDGHYIEISPLSGADVEGRIEDGLVVYPGAYRDTDVLYKSTPTHVDEYLLLRTADAPTRWEYHVELGPRLARLRQGGNTVEAVDERGLPWLRANRPYAVDGEGNRVEGTIVIDGDRLIVDIDVHTLSHPVLVDPDWRSTGDMAFGRFYHGANLLRDGRIFVTGGMTASVCSGDLSLPSTGSIVSAAEVLDLGTLLWSRVGDSLVPRMLHVAETLSNGDILIAGGCSARGCEALTDSVEIYDGEEFRSIDPLPATSAGMMSVALDDGRLLVAGGCDSTACTPRTLIFDPADETWTPVADMQQARGRAEIATLPDGRVLVVGGCTAISCAGVLDSAEVYDPSTDEWTAVGSMMFPRGGHWSAPLLDGRVVVGGGCPDGGCASVHDTTEVFDPVTNSFSLSGTQVQPRFGALAQTLPNGSVMVSQGCETATDCDLSNEIYDPGTGDLNLIEQAVTSRAFHSLLLQPIEEELVSIGGCQPRTCSWWNETYDVSSLVLGDAGPGTDAGLDAAPAPDAAPRDAGMDAGGGDSTVPPPGCGCRVDDGSTLRFAWALVLFVLIRRRR